MVIWCCACLQAVEAKEKVKVGTDSVTQASVTYQCFFRYYPKLAGMTVSCFAVMSLLFLSLFFFIVFWQSCLLAEGMHSPVLLQIFVQAC